MYNTRIKIFKSILSLLLNCFENKAYKRTFWNKIVGYGLVASDFENPTVNCSRRVFSHWKNYLLDRKLIKIPRVKRKRRDDGSYSSSHNVPYIITPLGICYFSSLSNAIGEKYGKKIIKFLSFDSAYNLDKDWGKICEIMGNNEPYEILKKVCGSIDIIDEDDKIQVVMKYRTKGEITYEFFRYIINKREIRLQLSEDVHTNESLLSQTPVSTPIVDEELFHKDVAEFIVEAFCYSIIENCHWKIMNKSRTLNWADLTAIKKIDFKNSMTEYESRLEKLPFAIHLTAFNFIGQKTFGIIKQEQEFANKVSDYFHNKIAPKYRLKFADDGGKPFELFS